MKLPFQNSKYILPWWIKILTLIYAVGGILASIKFVMASFNFKTNMEMYGLKTSDPLNALGLIILGLLALKSAVSIGILREKIWAFKLGVLDTWLGIALCIFEFGIKDLLFHSNHVDFEFRLELLVLIPFLLYLIRNKEKWYQAVK